ncbi:MAG TPA: NUDIX domain-containing protein [Candidatus Limnocylindrales bacterium]|nr:NUDIX domain-containing protein [Candidatus Limnocylindrales bacterium]
MTEPYRHSVSVAAVVVNDDGEILVIQRRDNDAWQLPGGILEPHESIHDGVRREVLEETGLHVEPMHLTGVYKNIPLGVVALVFLARHVEGAPQPTDESAAVEWRAPARITEEMTEAFATRIIDALEFRDHPAVRHHDGTNLLQP